MGEALALHRSLFNQVLRGFDMADYSLFANEVQVQVRYKHMIHQRLDTSWLAMFFAICILATYATFVLNLI